MQRKKNKTKIFKSGRAREWTIDFLIAIGMFVLVAFFASTHTNAALPAPLAKTQVALQTSQIAFNADYAYERSVHAVQHISMQNTDDIQKFIKQQDTQSSMMLFMALIFSGLLTLTIQFWRNLRRAYAYASPRRKWGRG